MAVLYHFIFFTIFFITEICIKPQSRSIIIEYQLIQFYDFKSKVVKQLFLTKHFQSRVKKKRKVCILRN